jgi:hypothetical protein
VTGARETDDSERSEVPDGADRSGRSEVERRRLREKVFGEVLPDGTRDERADGWSEREPGREADDDWLRRQVPPHHG